MKIYLGLYVWVANCLKKICDESIKVAPSKKKRKKGECIPWLVNRRHNIHPCMYMRCNALHRTI